MNSMLHWIRNFLVNHSVWMHFTLILILSYLMIQLSHLLSPEVYYLWVLGLTMFSLPVLAFVIYRDVVSSLKRSMYWGIWGLVFFAWPLILFLLGIDVNSLPFAHRLENIDINGAYTYASLSILFLILELLLFPFNKAVQSKVAFTQLQYWSVFRISMISVAIFCIFAMLSNNFFHQVTNNDSGLMRLTKFIIYLSQLFIIYASYYFYYYIHHHVLYKNVLKKRGFIAYFLGIGLTLILIAPPHNWLISLFPVVQDLKLHPTAMVELFDDFNFGLASTVLIISLPMIVIIEWYKQANKVSELEQQKSKAELSLLKQQINPHFFFNTLNNLYSMSLTEDKQTPETILQLSELMRYVIYKGKEEKVTLKEEVQYIKDYIQLQMIRVHKSVDLKMNFDLENESSDISPLLFIILLENAFKHGIEPASAESALHIIMQESDGVVHFECYNSKPKEDTNDQSKGIGISNLRKRLQIVYPDQHQLTIDDQPNSYRAILKINL